jgi:hypothetical protein
VTNFNISLIEGFNQTGAGVFCMKETGRNAIMDGFMKSNISMDSMEGMNASIQIIQISHSGSSLYNVSFSSLLYGRDGHGDERCVELELMFCCSARILHSAPTQLSSATTSAQTRRVFPASSLKMLARRRLRRRQQRLLLLARFGLLWVVDCLLGWLLGFCCRGLGCGSWDGLKNFRLRRYEG